MKKVLVAGLAVALLSGTFISVDLTVGAGDAVAMNKSERPAAKNLNAGEQKGNSAQTSAVPFQPQGDRTIIIIGGRVAGIQGKMVTVTDMNGKSSTFEVSNAKDLRVGDKVNVKNSAIEKVIVPYDDGSRGNKAVGLESSSGANKAVPTNKTASSPGSSGQKGMRSEEEPDGSPNSRGLQTQSRENKATR